VRTTLKRGLGRGAGTAETNGHSVLPPAPLSPVSRYRQPESVSGAWAVLGRVLLWLTLGAVVVACGFAGGWYLYLHESFAATAPHSHDVKAAAPYLDRVPPPDHAAIALVIGYDHRAGVESDQSSRSDTILLLRADPQTKSISMLSFPRDLLTEIHCPGVPPYQDKINAAYSKCGSKGTLKTVEALTGLPVNYLITVDFHGFKQVVNELGGVWVDVDQRYYNRNVGTLDTDYANINLQPGYQLLSGGSALDFVRYRHTDSDLYRVARQQLFVEAMKQQFHRAFSPLKVPKLLNTITHSIEVAPALDLGTVLRYALFAYRLPGGHFFQSKIGGLTGYSDLTTDSSNIAQAVSAFANPDVQAPSQANSAALGIKPKVHVPKPSETTIVTLNGNGQEGSASTLRYLLQQEGYQTLLPPAGATGNAPEGFVYNHTAVFYDAQRAGVKAAARKLATLLVPADLKPMTRAIRLLSNGAMIVVVTGATFHGTIAPPQAAVAPEHQPPQIVADESVTKPLVETMKGKVKFTLEYPTVIETNSSPARDTPVRAYTIQGKHRAVRMTFSTGLEYWGIEETDWNAAPVLGERSFHHVLGGRPFDLYYSGPHLHMIVLHQAGATYWVVNTLLDTLTNETMIAIAKGLRPLRG